MILANLSGVNKKKSQLMIHFTAPSWNGIIVKSTDPRNKMEYCTINAAGNEAISSSSIGGSSYAVKSALTIFGKLN